jgi:hypothetical protein
MCCSQDMMIKGYEEIPTCNLAKTSHNKWLQQIGNKITCLYKAKMDSMICAFMQIANYWTWLTGGSNGNGLDLVSLEVKVVTMSGHPKMLVNAMKFYLRQKKLTTKTVHWRVQVVWVHQTKIPTLPPGVNYNSHQPNKVNHSILRPNTQATCQHIEKPLSYAKRGVDHTTFVLEIVFLTLKWHIARLSLNLTKPIVQCQSRDQQT